MNSAETLPHLLFDSERLSHAYIAGCHIAETLAAAVVCSGSGARPCLNCRHCDKAQRGVHPDVITIGRLPDKREIAVDQIRQLKKDIIVVPGEAEKKVYVINDADSMNTAAQNAFLQMLEETPLHAAFILKTDNPAALLQTVRSRCIEISARIDSGTPDAEMNTMADDFFSALECGNVALIRFMFRLEKLDKDELEAFLTAAQGQAAARLRGEGSGGAGIPNERLSRAEQTLDRAMEFLDLNVSSGHISGMICATLVD